jgi:hypothetical protein
VQQEITYSREPQASCSRAFNVTSILRTSIFHLAFSPLGC